MPAYKQNKRACPLFALSVSKTVRDRDFDQIGLATLDACFQGGI
jgi:hypothetical protein